MEICWGIFAFFRKTTPYGKIYKILFRKFSPPHRSTSLCSNFVKCCRRIIGKIVRYLPDKKTLKFRLLLILSLLRGSHPKSTRARPQQCRPYSECSRFHPNRFTFGGVIAKRVNTDKSHCRVNRIFGQITSNNWLSYGCMASYTEVRIYFFYNFIASINCYRIIPCAWLVLFIVSSIMLIFVRTFGRRMARPCSHWNAALAYICLNRRSNAARY